MRIDANPAREEGLSSTDSPDPSIHVRSPKQSRSRDTLDRLHAAALELMAEHGVEGVTVRDVVEKAGSSVGSFYARFSGREQLVRYLRAHAREEVLEEWEAALLRIPELKSLPLLQRVEILVEGLLELAGRDESRTLLMQDRNGPVQRRMRNDAVSLLQPGATDPQPSRPAREREDGGEDGGRNVALGWEMTVAAAGALLTRQLDEAEFLAPGQIREALVRLLMGYLSAPPMDAQSAELMPQTEAGERSPDTDHAEPPPPALPEPEPEPDFVDPFDVWA
ncbi:MAG: helix-turn-helix domain-containing protein [Gemmatimonadota bacterium]